MRITPVNTDRRYILPGENANYRKLVRRGVRFTAFYRSSKATAAVIGVITASARNNKYIVNKLFRVDWHDMVVILRAGEAAK